MKLSPKVDKYLFPPFYGLVVYFTIRLVVDTISNFKFWERPLHTNLIEIIGSAAVGYLFLWAIKHTETKFDRRNLDDFGLRNILKEFWTVLLYSALIINVVIVPMAAVTDNGLQLFDFITINIIPGFYVMLLFMFRRANYYLRAFVDHKLKLEKITQEQLKSEMEFLKGQFHPHFLFNALNTIYFQMDENIGGAKKSVEKLSELLRYRLYDHGERKVKLADEFTYIRNYIDFQKTRKSERLMLDFSVPDSINGEEIYPFLLLPFVENAFKYVAGDMHMELTLTVKNDVLRYHCVNSVDSSMPPKDGSGGIGQQNLKRRLEILYPDKHHLELQRGESSYVATLEINLN